MNLRFRKRHIVIEAFQMTRERRADNTDWPDWLNRAWNMADYAAGAVRPWAQGAHSGPLAIATLEGDMRCEIGDWIIQGVKGELYPCKPDIFAATYEECE